MEDRKIAMGVIPDFSGVLPETLEEAERLAASIERAVQSETDWGVVDLMVEVSPQGCCFEGVVRRSTRSNWPNMPPCASPVETG